MALHRISASVMVVLIVSVTSGLAADLEAIGGGNLGGAMTGGDVERIETASMGPRISGTLPERTDAKLREAFPVALQRINDIEECQSLFTTLGADALEKFTTSSYRATTAQMEVRACQRGVSAFTYVGSPQTRLCRRFASLGTERAAATLIHEALHWAGLSEKPQDKDGLDARDIDRMVKKSCDL